MIRSTEFTILEVVSAELPKHDNVTEGVKD
jgi:hypothetical protein